MQTRLLNRFQASIIAIVIGYGTALLHAETPPSPDKSSTAAVYDPDPNHLWNRLFATFYRQQVPIIVVGTNQVTPTELWMGPDVLDPPIANPPGFLLQKEEFARCEAVLDEFLQQSGERLVRDPLKRAVLQRDLWAVFDIVQESEFTLVSRQNRRLTLGRKLAQAIRALALSREEIEALPNTFREALDSGAFSSEPKRNHFNLLPADLFKADSDWIETASTNSLFHSRFVKDRSVFRVFVKFPPGSPSATAASEWRKRIEETRKLLEKNPGQTFDYPPAPNQNLFQQLPGMQLLLLREMICLDAQGHLTPTHIVESVQMRGIVGEGTNTLRYARELELNRSLLFQHSQGGLKPIVRDELRVDGYGALGALQASSVTMRPFPQNCANCHSAPGIFSVGLTIARVPNQSGLRTIAGKIDRADFVQLRAWMAGSKH